jgi:hypothetical protein
MLHPVFCEKLGMALKLVRHSGQDRLGQLLGPQNVVDNLGRQGLMIQRTRGVNKKDGHCCIPKPV